MDHKELVQKKFDRMMEIFKSAEMKDKFAKLPKGELDEYAKKLSEIRFVSMLDAAKAAKDQQRYQEIMLQALPLHPLKEDELFIEVWNLACDPDVINVAVNDLEEEFE